MRPNQDQGDSRADADIFPPRVFMVGAKKAGTTYLANLLDQTPHITLANSKEPHFFTKNWDRGLAWYREEFRSAPGNVLLDASTSYAAAPVHRGLDAASYRVKDPRAGVPDRIKSVSPDARFIYVLREPVARLWSSYWHDVRHGVTHDTFETALERNPVHMNASDYLNQIRLYQRTFPLDRFLFLRFEDLRRDPGRVIDECLQFLGLPPNQESLSIDANRHASYQPGRLAGWLIRTAKRRPVFDKLQNRVWAAIPPIVQRDLRRRLTKPVRRMSDSERVRLAERFAPMVDDLESLTGLDLSVWRSVSDSARG